VFPSRVTPGAEVAVTSVGIRMLQERYPDAEIVLLGSPRLEQLFGSARGLRIAEVGYARHGGLLERFRTWLGAVDAVRDLGSDSVLVVDPDSRITQLGLLPLTSDANYLPFNGSSAALDDGRSLGELFADRLSRVLGTGEQVLRAAPYIALKADDVRFAVEAFSGMELNNRRCASISFGVGGNEDKRIGEHFELELVQRLMELGWAVVLDMGIVPSEVEAARRVMRLQEEQGYRVASFSVDEIPSGPVDLAGWDGDMGKFAALISRTDHYLGYDSLFQHVAAAQGISLVTLFTGFSSPVFPRRWRPVGTGRVEVIEVSDKNVDAGGLVRDVFELMR